MPHPTTGDHAQIPRANLHTLELALYQAQEVAGALRAAADVAMGDGSACRTPEFQFLKIESFISLMSVFHTQLNTALNRAQEALEKKS